MDHGGFSIPRVVPAVGFAGCVLLLLIELALRLTG
jgi:hypothetical protein